MYANVIKFSTHVIRVFLFSISKSELQGINHQGVSYSFFKTWRKWESNVTNSQWSVSLDLRDTTGGQSPTIETSSLPHKKTPGIKLSSEPTFTVWCNHLFPLLTFTPVWNDRRKFLLVWIYFFLEQHVNGWEEGSITWLYIYPSEKNALFVLIWSSGDTDPYMKSFFSYQRWKTISVPEDGLLKIQQNRVNKDVVRLITGPMAKRMKK